MSTLRRRDVLASGTLLVLSVRPAQSQSPPLAAALADAVRAWAGGHTPRDGRVTLDIAPLVDNGNAVPISVRVASPMTEADHVREIAVFNARNPQREVLRCELSAANGRAEVSSRIRLATSQQLVAVARLSDGSLWQQRVEVLVTLAACIEG
jgi:sulfur-oxidizing protein SoxY